LNFTRRSFLFGSIACLGGLTQTESLVFAKAAKKRDLPVKGPHIVARQHWSPAISADFVAVADLGVCCLANEFGRVSFVDLNKAGPDGKSARVISELSGIGKKVFDFGVAGRRAFALIDQSTDTEQKLGLAIINLSPIVSPAVVATLPLDKLSEATAIAAWQDMICVAGSAASGESLVICYTLGKGKNNEATFQSSLTFDRPVAKIDLQNRVLTALQTGENSKIVTVSYLNPSSPQVKNTLELTGNYSFLARSKDMAIAFGETSPEKFEAQLINLHKAPQLVTTTTLSGIKSIDCVAAQGDNFLLLAETANGRSLFPYTVMKSLSLFSRPEVAIVQSKGPNQGQGRIATSVKSVFVASGWAGVTSFNLGKTGLSPATNYSIPRLPASGLATWGNLVVVASADLNLYNIEEPSNPVLLKTSPLTTALKAVTQAGSFLLCLGKDSITLRKIDKPEVIAASFPTTGKHLCFDPVNQTAYLLREEKRKTVVDELKVYSNKLMPIATFDVAQGSARVSASGGYLLVGALNDMTLYGVGKTLDSVGTHHFPNLALRDFAFGDEYIFAAAVDQKSQGFLLVLSKDKDDKGELKVMGSVDLPHDGVALAVSGRTVVTVGRSFEGKDLTAVVDVTTIATPKIIATLPALESVSSVAIKGGLALIAGRGLEILVTS